MPAVSPFKTRERQLRARNPSPSQARCTAQMPTIAALALAASKATDMHCNARLSNTSHTHACITPAMASSVAIQRRWRNVPRRHAVTWISTG